VVANNIQPRAVEKNWTVKNNRRDKKEGNKYENLPQHIRMKPTRKKKLW
jgi:hypothetical protein